MIMDNQEIRNMYDCLLCPKCNSKYRYPMRDQKVYCDDCGYIELWDCYLSERMEIEK